MLEGLQNYFFKKIKHVINLFSFLKRSDQKKYEWISSQKRKYEWISSQQTGGGERWEGVGWIVGRLFGSYMNLIKVKVRLAQCLAFHYLLFSATFLLWMGDLNEMQNYKTLFII